MTKKLTILFAPIDGFGHVNACIGVAEVLRDRGHRIVFIINKSWKGKLTKYGFEEELFTDPTRKENENPAEFITDFLLDSGMLSPLSPLEKMKRMWSSGTNVMLNQIKENDPIIKLIVDKVKPDVIVIDHAGCTPSLVNAGVPWVWLVSTNPLFAIWDDRTPPCGSGN